MSFQGFYRGGRLIGSKKNLSSDSGFAVKGKAIIRTQRDRKLKMDQDWPRSYSPAMPPLKRKSARSKSRTDRRASVKINKPFFTVGSSRSGISILTWCLGQHQNIFVQEESDWIGRFALLVEIACRTGTAPGERSQFSALRAARDDFFVLFGRSNAVPRAVPSCFTRGGVQHYVMGKTRFDDQLIPLVPQATTEDFLSLCRSLGDGHDL
jgi:hypothetical protein